MSEDRTALAWTSTDVVADVRRRASIPTTSTDWTDAVILREATNMIWSFAGWAVAQGGEGRLLESLDRPVATAVLTGPYRAGSEVGLPPLAVAGTIESVTFVDQTGATQTRLQRIDPAQEADLDAPGSEGTPQAYALLAGRLRLYPRPTSGGIIRISYQRRHPELVPLSEETTPRIITAAADPGDANRTRLTLGGVAPSILAWTDLDIISVYHPHRTFVTHVNVADTQTTTIYLDIPFSYFANAKIAQWNVTNARVVRSGQSPYVQLPLELRAALSEKTAAEIMRAMGDAQGAQMAEQAAMLELSRVLQMLSPRTKRDKPRAVNPYSHLRLSMSRWRW